MSDLAGSQCHPEMGKLENAHSCSSAERFRTKTIQTETRGRNREAEESRAHVTWSGIESIHCIAQFVSNWLQLLGNPMEQQ